MQAGQRVGAFASVWFSLVIKLSGSQTVSHLSMAEQQRWCLDVTVIRFISSLPYWHYCASLFIRLPTAWSACWKAVFLGQIETLNRHLLKLYRWVVTESELGFDFIGATKQWLCRLLALPVASCGPQLDDEAVHCMCSACVWHAVVLHDVVRLYVPRRCSVFTEGLRAMVSKKAPGNKYWTTLSGVPSSQRAYRPSKNPLSTADMMENDRMIWN